MSDKRIWIDRLRHPLFYWLVTALALRLFRIDFRSIWLDEAYSQVLAAADFKGIIQGAAMDIHPPLFHLVLHGWSTLFGTSEFALRSLSAFVGVLLIPVVYGMVRDWSGRKAASWAAGLAACSPYLIELSRSGRMGAMLILFSAISIWMFWRTLQRPTIVNSIAYCLATLAAMYTHYFGFLVFAAQHVYVFMGIGKLHLSRDVRKNWFLLQAFLLAGYAPWLPVLWDHISQGGPGWRGTGAAWWEPIHSLYSFWAGTACWSFVNKVVFLACLGLAGAVTLHALLPRIQQFYTLVKPRIWGLLLTLIFVPLGLVWIYSSGKLNVFDNRYMSISGLALLMFSAVLFSGLPVRRQWLVGGLVAAAFAVPLGNQYFVYGYYDDWRQAAAQIAADGQAESVAVYPPWNATPLNYYLKGQIPIQGIPGDYDPVTGRTSPYFHIKPETIGQLEALFSKKESLWLITVNEGMEQDLVKTWFEVHYHKKEEKDLKGIHLMRFDKAEER